MKSLSIQYVRYISKVRKYIVLACSIILTISYFGAHASTAAKAGEVPVTVDNFVRAATEIEFGKYLAISGGVNQFFHSREPTPIARQPTVRMNRDTLYSMAVIDVSKGATLTLPDTGKRYISAQIVNQDHDTNAVFVGGGTYSLDLATFGTPYVVAIVRTLVDASSADDLAVVTAIQDRIALKAESANPFVIANYDREDYKKIVELAKSLSSFIPDSGRTFGPKNKVDPVRHFLGTAYGWGGLPESAAFYISVVPNLPVGQYKLDVPAAVPVGAFWSVSLYNADGFFEQNSLGAYNINSVMGKRNPDGSMTVHLGGCDDGRVNCLPIMDGWNYTVRLYQPAPEILNGKWTFPAVAPVK